MQLIVTFTYERERIAILTARSEKEIKAYLARYFPGAEQLNIQQVDKTITF